MPTAQRLLSAAGLIGLLLLAAVVMSRADGVDAASALRLAGLATGWTGLALLMTTAALSARLPRFDRHFGGLTRMWQTHHRLGAASLVLLMAHPLLLALAALPASPDAAIARLLPAFSDWATWSGWSALLLMMVFLAPSFAFFGRPEYQRWKRVHMLAAPAVLLALLHASAYQSLLPAPLNAVALVALGLPAVAALAWHLGFARRFGRLRYRVAGVIAVANNVVELVLEPAGRRRLRYRAGQFIYLAPYDRRLANGYGEEHPYTLTSAPGGDELRVAVKALGDATQALQTVRPGSRVTVEGPYGALFPEHPGTPELWIAGGIGIAPFLGRIRHLRRTGAQADVRLIYCVQDEARARFLEELTGHADAVPGFDLTMHYFYRQGPLDSEFLAFHCDDVRRRAAFICGPAPLDALATRLLREAGVPRERIHHETFELL